MITYSVQGYFQSLKPRLAGSSLEFSRSQSHIILFNLAYLIQILVFSNSLIELQITRYLRPRYFVDNLNRLFVHLSTGTGLALATGQAVVVKLESGCHSHLLRNWSFVYIIIAKIDPIL